MSDLENNDNTTQDAGDLKLSSRDIAAGILMDAAETIALGLGALVEAVNNLRLAGELDRIETPIGDAFLGLLQAREMVEPEGGDRG